MEAMPFVESLRGPTGYENWRAIANQQQPRSMFELQLYSDAHLTDEVASGCGPYTFHNTVPAAAIGTFSHVATVRISMHLDPVHVDMSQTDHSRYHGGWHADEVSALCSLLIGVRLKSGGVSRNFDGGDQFGRPWADTGAPASPLPRLHHAWIIPRACESHNIRTSLLPRLTTYPLLAAKQAIALVRAARLYQDAIWVAEAEPELAWLLLVAAVEVVASEHRATTNPPEETLRNALPLLHEELLRVGGKALVTVCAGHMSKLLSSTTRFLNFLGEFLPPQPERPGIRVVEIPWDKVALKKRLSKIYSYRSLALHDGTPFPRPMCHSPMLGGCFHEQPSGLASATNEGTWMAEDLPMLLHVFEHIARGAILGWWDSLTTSDPGATPAVS